MRVDWKDAADAGRLAGLVALYAVYVVLAVHLKRDADRGLP